MQLPHLHFEVTDPQNFDIEARIVGKRIGYIYCEREGGDLKICDFSVEPAYRARGVGSQLLRRVLAAADPAGVKTVWGLVTQRDLRDWPGLLDWYRGFGFRVADVTDDDLRQACDPVAKIIRDS